MLIDCVPYAKHHSCLRGRHNQENIPFIIIFFWWREETERNEIKNMGKKGCFCQVGGLPEIGLEVRSGGGKLESGTEYSQSLKLMSHSFLWEKKKKLGIENGKGKQLLMK